MNAGPKVRSSEGGEGDPLASCLIEIARHFGFALGRGQLGSVALDTDGRIPFHQCPVLLDQLGLINETLHANRLPQESTAYPLIVWQTDGRYALIFDANEGQVLVWRPETGTPVWTNKAEFPREAIRQIISVAGDPDALRDEEAPWHAKGRKHWFWSEIRKEVRSFRPVIVASLIINLLALALPLFSMNVYDRVLPNKAESTLWVLAIGVLLAFGLEFALRTARANVVDRIGLRLDQRLSQKIYARLLSIPLSARQGHTGALAARVSEFATVRDFFGSTTVVLIVDLAFLVLFVAAIAYIGGWLALIPLAAIAGMALAGWYLQRKVSDAARNAQADHGLQQTLLVETIAGSETVKAMAAEGGMIGRWYQLSLIGRQSQLVLRNINMRAVALASTFQQVSSISLVVGGYYLFAAEKISMGAIIAIVMLASRSLAPAGQIAFLLTRYRQAEETLASIERLFEGEDERRRGGISAPPSLSSAVVSLEEVEFAYPESSTLALDRINLRIEPGERIGIIGRVASGKSTLGRLLCGLYEPTGGAMLIDGMDSRQLRPQDLREQFRFVGQDADLFSGSLRDNLTLGRSVQDEASLMRALQITGAEQFLARDAGGFERKVGEHGRRLSGGQRSFVALARALVTPANLLFLDEPSGAMDSQTEKLLVERLSQNLSKQCTLVVSTHRPALLSLCDRLIILDKGKIVADGPMQEIIARSGMPRN